VAHPVAAAARRDVRWRRCVAPVALFLVGLGLYSINLDQPPRTDELYHVLGARGYLEYGDPRIVEGVYGRARYFTAAIALLFGAFGESLVVGRLLSVVCGSLLVSLLFVWVRGVAGEMAAWFAAVGFLISPFAAQVFPDLRFYAPFTLFFWLGAMAVYAASTAEHLSPGRLAWLALAAAACLGAAFHLQSLALIGVVGIGFWLGVQLGLPRPVWVCPGRHPRHAARAGHCPFASHRDGVDCSIARFRPAREYRDGAHGDHARRSGRASGGQPPGLASRSRAAPAMARPGIGRAHDQRYRDALFSRPLRRPHQQEPAFRVA
jgi:hypothetical protein